MRRLASTSLAFLCTALLVAGCGAARTAEPRSVSRLVLRDGRDDLWSGIPFPNKLTPVTLNGDAVGALVKRTAHALLVTVRYADLEPRANPGWGIEFAVDIPGDELDRQVAWSEYQYADTHRWDREADFTTSSSEDSLPGCPGSVLRAEPDFAVETVTIRVPDRCFEHAPWVVVKGLSAVSFASRARGRAVDYVGIGGPKPTRTPRLIKPSWRRAVAPTPTSSHAAVRAMGDPDRQPG